MYNIIHWRIIELLKIIVRISRNTTVPTRPTNQVNFRNNFFLKYKVSKNRTRCYKALTIQTTETSEHSQHIAHREVNKYVRHVQTVINRISVCSSEKFEKRCAAAQNSVNFFRSALLRRDTHSRVSQNTNPINLLRPSAQLGDKIFLLSCARAGHTESTQRRIIHI